jgi:tRNA(Ile)-lysidine synthase
VTGDAPDALLGPHPAGLDRPALVDAVAADAASLPPEAAVVLALSGGPDSSALAYLLAEARPDLALTLVHVRHGLRDDTADLGSVHRHAAYLGLPLEVLDVEVRPDGHGTQAAARDARYAALRATAARLHTEAIAIAHTADDQAETVLLRAARGTGIAGLGAMAVRDGDLVRPALRVRRADLRTFLDAEGLTAADDPGNHDPAGRRVRVRTRVLPALAGIGPDPVGALGRLAALAADDDAALVAAAAAVAVVRVGTTASVIVADLALLPVAVRRRVTRRLVAELAGGTPPSAADTEACEHLTDGRRHPLPGDVEVSEAGGWRTYALPVHPVGSVALTVPGRTPWAPAGIEVAARTPDAAGVDETTPPGQIAFELPGAWTPPAPDLARVVAPPGGHPDRCHLVLPPGGTWSLRHRHDGDRVRAAAGTTSVADALADAGVPRPVRDRWPVLVDRDDEVRWVPGVTVDAAVAAAGRATPALQLVVRPPRPRRPR